MDKVGVPDSGDDLMKVGVIAVAREEEVGSGDAFEGAGARGEEDGVGEGEVALVGREEVGCVEGGVGRHGSHVSGM